MHWKWSIISFFLIFTEAVTPVSAVWPHSFLMGRTDADNVTATSLIWGFCNTCNKYFLPHNSSCSFKLPVKRLQTKRFLVEKNESFAFSFLHLRRVTLAHLVRRPDLDINIQTSEAKTAAQTGPSIWLSGSEKSESAFALLSYTLLELWM